MLIMLLDAAERLGSIPGAKPLPAKSPHRRRGHMLSGSCGYMRALPPGPGVPPGNIPVSLHLQSLRSAGSCSLPCNTALPRTIRCCCGGQGSCNKSGRSAGR